MGRSFSSNFTRELKHFQSDPEPQALLSSIGQLLIFCTAAKFPTDFLSSTSSSKGKKSPEESNIVLLS